jgi:hypothetical protein
VLPDGSGRDRRDEVLEFGSGRPGRRLASRALLACLVAGAIALIVLRSGGSQRPRPGATAPSAPPAVRVTTVGHRLLGITAGWQLLARGPADLVRIQFARGRITQTYVPSLASGNPDVAFVAGADEAIIRSADLVPGYVVPDGHQARLLTGSLAGSGPLVPGPAGTRAAWVITGPPTSPALSLVTLTGHRVGPSIRFPAGSPQLPVNAVSDGRGDVLVIDGNFDAYDAGPGWDRRVPGTVVAVGPADWLTVTCGPPQFRDCRNEVIGVTGGSRRVLPGPADQHVLPGPAGAEPYEYSWPPTGVIAPDGSSAAVVEVTGAGAFTVHLISLRTGITRDLGVPVSDNANDQAMAWSPDSRWLFVAARGRKLVAISARTGRVQRLGVSLPAVEQVAIRS